MSRRDPIADVDILRASLYEVVEKNARGLTGPQVVRCLKEASEEMYAAGIDEALRMTESRIEQWDHIASAWDLTWMTLFAHALSKIRRK